jgi:hypothetical protein
VGLSPVDLVASFAKRTPVAKCISLVRGTILPAASPPKPKDAWYYLGEDNRAHGPFQAGEMARVLNGQPCYVWREGMPEWAANLDCPQYIELSKDFTEHDQTAAKFEPSRTMSALLDVCKGIMTDGVITTEEVIFLSSWLQDAGLITEWPASEIAQTVERILEDGIITEQEKSELAALFENVTSSSVEEKRPHVMS